MTWRKSGVPSVWGCGAARPNCWRSSGVQNPGVCTVHACAPPIPPLPLVLPPPPPLPWPPPASGRVAPSAAQSSERWEQSVEKKYSMAHLKDKVIGCDCQVMCSYEMQQALCPLWTHSYGKYTFKRYAA